MRKRRKTYRAEGVITVYLTLVFGILAGLILAGLKEVRYSALKLHGDCLLDLSLFSAFGEYRRDLFEKYAIFGIDTSYGTETASFHYTEEHMLNYARKNVEMPGGSKLYAKDLYGIQIPMVELQQVELLTDYGGAPFRQQATYYMESQFGLAFVDTILGQLESFEAAGLSESERKEFYEATEGRLRAAETSGKWLSDEDWQEVSYVNPAKEIRVNRERGILNVVSANPAALSQKAIDLSTLCSHRKLNQGNLAKEYDFNNLIEHAIFDEYLMKSFGNYAKPRDNASLSYELEYLLIGANNDIENLKIVCNTLCDIRTLADFISLGQDGVRMGEIQTFAETITAVFGLSELAPVITIAIMAGWSYAESLEDVKDLLRGKKVALIKDSTQWKTSLSGFMQYGLKDSGNKEKDNTDSVPEQGWGYEEYLRILLLLQEEKQLTYRAMDLMEDDLRKSDGNQFFRMDACISSVLAKMTCMNRDRYTYNTYQAYSYGRKLQIFQ